MKLRWVCVLGVVTAFAGIPLACWRTSVAEREVSARPIIEVKPPRATADAGFRSEPSSPRLMRMQVLDDPGFVKTAVPLRAPSSEHPGGTLVLGASSGIFEIDIESGAVLRQAAAPVENATYRLAAARSGVIATWTYGETHVAIFDSSLHLVAEHTLAAGYDPGVSTDGDLAVLAHGLLDGFELVRFEVSTGRKLASARFPGRVTSIRETGARVVAQNGRIHVLSTEPRAELRTYNQKLTKVGTIVLKWNAIVPGPPLSSTLSAAGEALIVTLDGQPMTVDPKSGAARTLPELPSGTWSDSIAVDADGRVLLDTGYLGESVSGPFRQLATLGTELLELDAWQEPVRRDSPVSAFFWGGRAVIVTQHPGVNVIRIDLERKIP